MVFNWRLLKIRRKELGMTQKKLLDEISNRTGGRVSIGRRQYMNLEKGHSTNLGPDYLAHIMSVLQKEANYFFCL